MQEKFQLHSSVRHVLVSDKGQVLSADGGFQCYLNVM